MTEEYNLVLLERIQTCKLNFSLVGAFKHFCTEKIKTEESRVESEQYKARMGRS